MPPEGKVKEAVKRYLKEEGVWHYMPIQNGMGVVGIPDIVACAPVEITADMVGKTFGIFFAVETKAPGKIKNTSANQKRHLKAIAEAKGVALATDSVGDVRSALERLKKYGVLTYCVP